MSGAANCIAEKCDTYRQQRKYGNILKDVLVDDSEITTAKYTMEIWKYTKRFMRKYVFSELNSNISCSWPNRTKRIIQGNAH